MLADQHFFWSEASVSHAESHVPLQTSVEFVRTYDSQAHEIIDAIGAAVLNAQAGLYWLRAEAPDLEEVRKALTDIVDDGKRAAEIVIRLRALVKVATANGASDR